MLVLIPWCSLHTWPTDRPAQPNWANSRLPLLSPFHFSWLWYLGQCVGKLEVIVGDGYSFFVEVGSGAVRDGLKHFETKRTSGAINGRAYRQTTKQSCKGATTKLIDAEAYPTKQLSGAHRP